MTRLRSLVALFVTTFTTIAVSAHDTWLLPKRAAVWPGTAVQLQLTSGMSFPLLDTPIKPERIDVARCRLNNEINDVTDQSTAAKALILNAAMKEAGVATCWVQLKPRELELTHTQVEEYFAEIDASPAVRNEWQNMKPPKRWREVYVKHAKTFVAVGSKTDSSWSEPVGMSLELVPETDPTALKRGDNLPVRVLKNGSPLSNFPVGIVFEGDAHGEIRTTDSDGRTVFRLQRAGRYMLRGTELRRSTKADLEWESDFTTLTVQTAPIAGRKTKKS